MERDTAPCTNPVCRWFTRYGSHTHCAMGCGNPAWPERRCKYCGLILCGICGHDMPLTEIPLLDDDYETICEPCCGSELGMYYDVGALAGATVLPCGHPVASLEVSAWGNATCRACDEPSWGVRDAPE